MIFIYMDDILIATPDNEPLHEQIVHEVLEMLQKEDFFLKLHKCHFHQRAMDYLGIHIEGGIICIDPTKRDGLTDWPKELENVHQVQSTLGVFRYQRPFIPGYTEIMRPMQRLTKKEEPFIWTKECTEAMRKIKRIMSSDLVLKRPDYSQPFILEVDASQYALGAILYQKDD